MRITDRTVTQYARLVLARMADKYGGDCTLNEIRVMGAVYYLVMTGGHCTPTQIANDTGIPKSTVSRSLASLVEKGWLTDEQDVEDRRRRKIMLSAKAREQRENDWQECINWLVEFSEQCELPNCPNKQRQEVLGRVASE